MITKTFSTMKANVGNNIQDTSSAMESIISEYIHNRYFDILRRVNWKAVKENYSFTLGAGVTLVSLPSDFGKEISVYDDTGNAEIDWISLNDLISTYADDVGVTGDVEQYTIVDTVNSTGNRYKYFKPHKIPATAITVLMPYSILPTSLASAGALTVIPCEDIIEYGATADAWRYKRQFAKANDFELLYEKGIQNLIWDSVNAPNRVNTFYPAPYSRETV